MNKTISVIMLVFLFLSACCFYQAKPVHAITTYLSDTFESFSTGWTVAGSPANPLKSAEQKHGDSFSAVVNCTLVANYAYGYKVVSSTPKSDYRISLWVYPSSTVNAISIQLGGGYNTTTSTYNFKFGLNCSGGQFYLQNGVTDGAPGTWENVGTMSNNTWHQIEAYFVKGMAKIYYYIDGVRQGDTWNCLNNVFPERFYFGDTSGSVFRGKFWIDDLVIDDTAGAFACSLTFYWFYSSNGFLDYNGTVLNPLNNGTVYNFSVNDTIRLIAFSDLARGNLGWLFFLHNGTVVLEHPFIFPINYTNHNVWVYFAVEQTMFPSFTMSPTIAGINQTVSFDCSGTWTLYYPIISSYWDFGDGHTNSTTGTTTTHVYDAVGNYTITVYPDDGYVGFGPSASKVMSVIEDTSWYIAPGFILGLICFMAVGFVFVKKRHS